jgi:type I restriction enzyme S subunit
VTFPTIPVSELVASGEAEVKTGPFGTQLKASDYQEEGTPVINVRNIGFGNIKEDKLEYIGEATVRRLASHLLRAEDIVFGRKGAVERHVFIRSGQSNWFQGSDCLRLRLVSKRVIPRFASYYFLTHEHKQWMMGQCSHGATMASLNQDIISRIQLPLPPLAEQRRIASLLSAYDDLIENNTRRIAILEEMARRIYEEWFVHFRFPGHEQVRLVESELGLIPEGWEQTTIGKVAANHDRKRKPLSKMQREQFKGSYPYYGAAKIFDYVREYIFDGRFVLMAEDGSVITPDGFPVLQLANGKFWANNHTHILQGTAAASTEFIYLRLSDEKITGYITGAAQPKITQENMNRIPVPLPPESVMQEFTAFVKPKFDLINVLERKNTNLRTTRDLLLPKLISGEIVLVADPNADTV